MSQNNDIADVKAAIATRLGTLTGVTTVITGRSMLTGGFPYARFYLSGFGQNLLDNAPTYKREYDFTIDFVHDDNAKSKAVNEATVEDLIDEFLNDIGENWSLTNNCMIVSVESGTIGAEQEHGATIMASCIMKVQIIRDTF